MDRHKWLDLNDTLDFILDGENDFDDISDSDSNFEPGISQQKLSLLSENLGQKAKIKIFLINSSFKKVMKMTHGKLKQNTTEKMAENVSVWRNSLLNDAGDITFQDLPVQLVPDDINTAYQYFIMLANDSLPY